MKCSIGQKQMIRVQRYIAMQITFRVGKKNKQQQRVHACVCDWVGESVQGRDSLSDTHTRPRARSALALVTLIQNTGVVLLPHHTKPTRSPCVTELTPEPLASLTCHHTQVRSGSPHWAGHTFPAACSPCWAPGSPAAP